MSKDIKELLYSLHFWQKLWHGLSEKFLSASNFAAKALESCVFIDVPGIICVKHQKSRASLKKIAHIALASSKV